MADHLDRAEASGTNTHAEQSVNWEGGKNRTPNPTESAIHSATSSAADQFAKGDATGGVAAITKLYGTINGKSDQIDPIRSELSNALQGTGIEVAYGKDGGMILHRAGSKEGIDIRTSQDGKKAEAVAVTFPDGKDSGASAQDVMKRMATFNPKDKAAVTDLVGAAADIVKEKGGPSFDMSGLESAFQTAYKFGIPNAEGKVVTGQAALNEMVRRVNKEAESSGNTFKLTRITGESDAFKWFTVQRADSSMSGSLQIKKDTN